MQEVDMTVWVVLLPLLVAVAIAAGLGSWRDRRRGSREVLMSCDPVRAGATVAYYVHVQDSLAG